LYVTLPAEQLALSGFAQGGAPTHDRRSQAISFQTEKILN
jgi:hypothetical protein